MSSNLRLAPPRPQPEDDANRYSGVGAVGMGFLSGDMSSDDDDDDDYHDSQQRKTPAPASHPIPSGPPAALRSGPPGIPPPAALQPAGQRPPPTNIPSAPQAAHPREDQRPYPPRQQPIAPAGIPPPNRSNQAQFNSRPVARPIQPISVPQPASPPLMAPGMSPHPLEQPKTPIAPAFARPKLANRNSMIKFSEEVIMRGNKEETLLSRSTPKGAEFWRRFSYVAKEEGLGSNGPSKKSSWLEKNQARASRMSACVWVASICILLLIGAGVGFGWYFTHDSPVSQPKALGGQPSNVSDLLTASSSAPALPSSTSSPIHTVTGDLPPSTTPPIPTQLAAAPTAPAKRAPAGFAIATGLAYTKGAHGSSSRRRGKKRLTFA